MSINTDATSVLSGLARTESTTSKSAMEAEKNKFLTLLTTQLRNQDPMKPMENAELTSQLAQMSTVDGIERLNKMMQSLLNSSELADNTALIGRGVLVEGKGLGLTDAGAIGGFEVSVPADKVTVTVMNASGQVVTRLEYDKVEAGSHNYLWDGKLDDGSDAAPGMYTTSVSATLNGSPVAVKPLQFGPVTGVVRGANSSDLQVGALGIYKLNDIKQIL